MAQYYEAIGRRKESTARVRVASGSGTFTVNDKEAGTYFPRVGDLQDVLRAPELRAAVGRMRQLPPLRGIFRKLQSLLEIEDVTVREVAQLISSDTIIAAKVLQIVNSAFFRTTRRITSVEQAVTHLGFATLRNVVRSAEVFAAWPEKAAVDTVNLERLQQHSQQVVAIAALAGARPACSDGAVVVRELQQAARLARHGTDVQYLDYQYYWGPHARPDRAGRSGHRSQRDPRRRLYE